MRDTDRLYVRALVLIDEYDLPAADKITGDNAIVSFADPRHEVIEYTCHELAHGALLGLLYGPRLAMRIGKRIHGEDDDRNEVETFTVVMKALDAFGIDYDPGVMFDACVLQVAWEPEEVRSYWETFRESAECARALERVTACFDGC